MSRYQDIAKQLLDDANYEVIRILVWGPGIPKPGSSPDIERAYLKRVKIKDVLQEQFPRAEVYFSEDPEMQTLSEEIIGQLEREALQAAAADVVIMLDISRGVDLELDYFVTKFSWFRDKAYVFLPERFVPPRGFVREVFDYLRHDHILGFSEEEFDTCSLANIKAVKIAKTVGLGHLLSKL